MLGDEEMMQYIKRQQAKKLATGVTQSELDAMLKFPEPKPPVSPTTPQGMYIDLNALSYDLFYAIPSYPQGQPGTASFRV